MGIEVTSVSQTHRTLSNVKDSQYFGNALIDRSLARLDSGESLPEFKGFGDSDKDAIKKGGATGITEIKDGKVSVIQYGKDVPVRYDDGRPGDVVFGRRIEIDHSEVHHVIVLYMPNVKASNGKKRNVTVVTINTKDGGVKKIYSSVEAK